MTNPVTFFKLFIVCRILLSFLTLCKFWYYVHIYIYMYDIRLRWSRGSVLAFSTQVCGFKLVRRIFRAKKILSAPSFGRKVKPSVPCRRFVACIRSLNLRGSPNLGKITTGHLSRPQFHISLLGSLASLRTEAPGG